MYLTRNTTAMSKKEMQPSPAPWRASGSHKSNGEARYVLEDTNLVPIADIRTKNLPAATIRANRKLIENAPRMARVLIEIVALAGKSNIPVKLELVELVLDVTGVDPRKHIKNLIVE